MIDEPKEEGPYWIASGDRERPYLVCRGSSWSLNEWMVFGSDLTFSWEDLAATAVWPAVRPEAPE